MQAGISSVLLLTKKRDHLVLVHRYIREIREERLLKVRLKNKKRSRM